MNSLVELPSLKPLAKEMRLQEGAGGEGGVASWGRSEQLGLCFKPLARVTGRWESHEGRGGAAGTAVKIRESVLGSSLLLRP